MQLKATKVLLGKDRAHFRIPNTRLNKLRRFGKIKPTKIDKMRIRLIKEIWERQTATEKQIINGIWNTKSRQTTTKKIVIHQQDH